MAHLPLRRIPTVALFALLLFLDVRAQCIPDSQRTVIPGVVYKKFVLPGPYSVDLLEVDLTTPAITLESYRPDGLTGTKAQANANDRPGHRVIGAINADFFSFKTGWPVGNQVVNGVVALGIHSSRSHLAIDIRRKPYIERLSFRGEIRTAAGRSHPIARVNGDRNDSTLVFYTTFRGSSSGTDSSGLEYAVEFIESPRTGDTLQAVVTAQGPGNMTIPGSGGILSAGKAAPKEFLASYVHTGDTVRLFLGFDSPLHSVMQVLGGAGRFLERGRYVADSTSPLEGITGKFTDVRHPRTFVGFSADTTTLFLCTVDGRQASSIGMTFAEMADFMTAVGATDAFNFDGGGSTTMVVEGRIVNLPSDTTGERPVANTLQVIGTALP
jgi:hypothetical protein